MLAHTMPCPLQLMWGFTANAILLIYYAAPLSTIATVVRTRSSASLHLPLAVMNTINGALWLIYGLAISDLFVRFWAAGSAVCCSAIDGGTSPALATAHSLFPLLTCTPLPGTQIAVPNGIGAGLGLVLVALIFAFPARKKSRCSPAVSESETATTNSHQPLQLHQHEVEAVTGAVDCTGAGEADPEAPSLPPDSSRIP